MMYGATDESVIPHLQNIIALAASKPIPSSPHSPWAKLSRRPHMCPGRTWKLTSAAFDFGKAHGRRRRRRRRRHWVVLGGEFVAEDEEVAEEQRERERKREREKERERERERKRKRKRKRKRERWGEGGEGGGEHTCFDASA